MGQIQVMANIAVVGGGPAGLMAAEQAARQGCRVTLFDAMPSVARKILMAGRGGLNLTHSEPIEDFVTRYGAAMPFFTALLRRFGPVDIRAWADGLGIATFVGTSGRVFPETMKAAPLVRAWVRILRGRGVVFHTRHRWLGFDDDGANRFATPDGTVVQRADATVLALGGASWPQLGATGAWTGPLASHGVRLAPWQPANCGFVVEWDDAVRRHQGTPLKNIAATFGGITVRGEIVLTARGLEGSPVYALAARLREACRSGTAVLFLDLKPDLDETALSQRLTHPRGRSSLSTWLRKTVRLGPAAATLLRWAGEVPTEAGALARRLKALPVPLLGPTPLAEAISSAGGMLFAELDETLMIRRLPGVFAAGEMIDWEAPTGGYLLTGCLATGWLAGNGAVHYASGGPKALLVRCHDNVS